MTAAPTLDRATIEKIVRQIVLQNAPGKTDSPKAAAPLYSPNLMVSISARHCHLSDKDVEILFGPGAKLTPDKNLYQDGFYAAAETVMIVGPRKECYPLFAFSAPRDLIARWSSRLPIPSRSASTPRFVTAARLKGRPVACWSAPKELWN